MTAWASFLDQHSPTLLALIRRSGVRQRDEVMEVYTRVCERLARHDAARLAARERVPGALVAWLAVVVRHVVVDWVRSRAGRRRHFAAIRRLGPLERQIFELRYWHEPPPDDLCAWLDAAFGRRVDRREVDDAIERVERALGDRQRAEIVAAMARMRARSPIDRGDGTTPTQVPDPRPGPEERLLAAERAAELAAIVNSIPEEDQAIVRLKFLHGRSHREIGGALGIEVTDDRVRRAIGSLRARARKGPRRQGARSASIGWIDAASRAG